MTRAVPWIPRPDGVSGFRWWPVRLAPLALLSLALVGAAGPLAPARAQSLEADNAVAADSRHELLRRYREAKSEALHPYEPSTLEKAALKVENDRIIERWLAGSQGFFPVLATITSGSGIAAGVGYRRQGLFDRQVDLLATASISHRQYWLAEAVFGFPRLARGRAFGEAYARRLDFPQEDFFGLGPDSRRADRTDFALRETSFGGSAGVRILPWLSAGAGLDYLRPDVGPGEGEGVASLDTLFGAASAPGFHEQPDFARYRVFLDLNHRRPRGNPRAGGQYRVTWSRYDDLDLDRFGFSRLEIDLQHYVPFLHERRVIALRALASFADGVASQQVPFYYQDTLGGLRTLRGFRSYRFRDRNLLLLQAEYRWEIFPALDAALFYDAGKVASRGNDVNLKNLEDNWGFGFRFGTLRGVFLRIDSAFGSDDGPHFYFTFSNVF